MKGARPEKNFTFDYWQRTAGTGSLGRPRWIGFGIWRDAPVGREAKAIVSSGWTRMHGGKRAPRCNEIACGRYRSPDPWYRLKGNALMRRLSPNNRKLDTDEIDKVSLLVKAELVQAIERDLAAIHVGTGVKPVVLVRDLEQRKRGWLRDATEKVEAFVRREQMERKKAAK